MFLTSFFGFTHEPLSFAVEEKQIPEDAIDTVRKYAELLVARELRAPDMLLVLDGDLDAEHPLEKEAFDSLFTQIKESGCRVCALSKTNRFRTPEGMSMVQLLQQSSPPGRWLYRVNESTSFVKLHPRATHIFRLDTTGDELRVASDVCANANDPVFLGYPYGLVDADARARVTFKEVERLRIIFELKLQSKHESSALNAHSILDRMNRKTTQQ